MNCSSARSSRASAPFSTTKRAPDIFGRGVEIHEAEPLADLKVLFRLEPFRKGRRNPMLAKFDIVVLVLAVRRIGERQVGNRGEFHIERRSCLPLGRLQFRHGRLEPGDLGAKIVGRDTILARHRHADLLRNGVAPLLRGLERQDRRPALFVQRDQRFRSWAEPAAPQALVKSFRVLSDRSDIVHDLASKRHSPQRPSLKALEGRTRRAGSP